MPGTVPILTDCKILLGGLDISGFSNSIAIEYGAEMLDDTRFGTAGTRSNKPGIKSFSATGGIFWDPTIDGALFTKVGAVREVMSFAPLGNAEGDRAYTIRGVSGTYNPLSGEVGTLMQSEVNLHSANTPLVRGVVLALGAKAASGNGVGVNFVTPVATGQKAYSGLHVLATTATSISVVVESDDNVGFSSPTTRLTHTLMTNAAGPGSDWQELAGPIATDIYWRSKWTIVGGPFTIYHVFGIQPV